MRKFSAVALVLTLTTAASAQSVLDGFRGQYGSATDPTISCASNPHQLDFMASPPHALLHWQRPRLDGQGQMSSGDRYDLLNFDDKALTLRLEGDRRRTDAGDRPIWILRLTDTPVGYCWGRTDWPSVHCEDQQLRCDSASS